MASSKYGAAGSDGAQGRGRTALQPAWPVQQHQPRAPSGRERTPRPQLQGHEGRVPGSRGSYQTRLEVWENRGAVEKLLIEQNRLLLSQLQCMTDPGFQDTGSIAQAADPETRKVLAFWAKEARHTLRHYETHKTLKEKYQKLHERNELHMKFMAEATSTWPWPKLYRARATPVQGETSTGREYDVDEAWAQIRL